MCSSSATSDGTLLLVGGAGMEARRRRVASATVAPRTRASEASEASESVARAIRGDGEERWGLEGGRRQTSSVLSCEQARGRKPGAPQGKSARGPEHASRVAHGERGPGMAISRGRSRRQTAARVRQCLAGSAWDTRREGAWGRKVQRVQEAADGECARQAWDGRPARVAVDAGDRRKRIGVGVGS